ncbi:MAG: DUF3097 family protein [Pseudoclavibacter sp.]|nr:DUF3097 family protein [Pseudoclavibacter sp.]
MFTDRYADDPVARMREQAAPAPPRPLPMRGGLWLEEPASGFFGELVSAERDLVTLRDFDGQRRAFPARGVFLHEELPVRLVRPERDPGRKRPARARSASGSFHVADARARVAREGRVFVEGRHDAELVERVWGHDLRVEGVVVEYLAGADRLEEALREFAPTRERRAGVLLDHLVPGSKEQRIADGIMRRFGDEGVLVVGHPFVDVWQSIRPERLGLRSWPVVPKGRSWKHGVLEALGWPREDAADVGAAWQRMLGRVRDYRDLEPSLLGRVEELIDFVTAPGTR